MGRVRPDGKSLRTGAASIAAPALYGIKDPPDLAANFLDASVLLFNSGVALLHPSKALPDMLAMLLVEAPVLFELAPVLSHLVHLTEDNLAQVPDHPSHFGILAPQIIDPCADLGEPSGRPIHVIPEDPRQAFECQSILRIRHLQRSP